MDTAPVHKKQKVASDTLGNTDAVPSASNRMSCQSKQSSNATSVHILEIIVQNGWFSWKDDEEIRQNPDYSNLRLVSSEMKNLMDKPECGGPEFDVIVWFLDKRNGFNNDKRPGFCDHCFLHNGEGCDTCKDYHYTECKCKKAHRFGDSVRKLDPRLNQTIEFDKLTPREQAKLLLRFLYQVVTNFNLEYYVEWKKHFPDLSLDDPDPDLTMIGPLVFRHAEFQNEMKLYNEPFYNFIHHLLFTGWAENDAKLCSGTFSPFRHRFTQDDGFSNLNGGRREDCVLDILGWRRIYYKYFDKIWDCFMRLHKSNDTPSVSNGGRAPFTLSQIQHIPETIRRCLENTVDHWAIIFLGKPIADNIDLYRLARQTYYHQEEELSEIQWQPSFGMEEEDFVPLDDFSGYNPEHVRDNIDCTRLFWKYSEDPFERL